MLGTVRRWIDWLSQRLSSKYNTVPMPESYRGFISFTHSNVRIALRLQAALESYRVPRHLPPGPHGRKLGKFCLDRRNLEPHPSLDMLIRQKLDNSEALIYLASPAAAKSDSVRMEIRHFLSSRRWQSNTDANGAVVLSEISEVPTPQSDRRGTPPILPFIVSGKVQSPDPKEECYPRELLSLGDNAGKQDDTSFKGALGANLSEQGWNKAKTFLIAGILKINPDELWKYEQRELQRRRALSALFGLMSLFLMVWSSAWFVTKRDAAVLRDRSVDISSEQWRLTIAPNGHESAFRHALAANRLEQPGAKDRWSLGIRNDSFGRALALSGRALSMRRVFGEPPLSPSQNSVRDDIPKSDPHSRREITSKVWIQGVGFSGDSKRLGVITSLGEVRVYDVSTLQPVFEQQLKEISNVDKIALDASGATALVAGDGKVQWIDIEQHQMRRMMESDPISTCTNIPGITVIEIGWIDNTWVIAGNRNDSSGRTCWFVSEVDRRNPRISCCGDGKISVYCSHALSNTDPRYLVLSSNQLYPVNLNRETRRFVKIPDLEKGMGELKAIAFNSRSKLVAMGGNGAGDEGSKGIVFSLSELREITRLDGHTGEIYCMSFIPGTDFIVTGGTDFSLRIYHSRTGVELIRLGGHWNHVTDCVCSPDGQWLASSSRDGQLLLWDVSWLQQLDSLESVALWRECESDRHSPGSWPVTIIQRSERDTTSAFQGRPWDLRDWQSPLSWRGTVQAIRALLYKATGNPLFDYDPPEGYGIGFVEGPRHQPAVPLRGEWHDLQQVTPEQPMFTGEPIAAPPVASSPPKNRPNPISTVSAPRFALSHSRDGMSSSIAWNQVDCAQFLRIRVTADLPEGVHTLSAVYWDSSKSEGIPSELNPVVMNRTESGDYELVIDHYLLKKNTTYTMRIADDQDPLKLRCAVSFQVQTLQ